MYLRALFILNLLCAGVCAAPPTNYYAAADGKAGRELRAALHGIIRGHVIIRYSSSQFDTSDALRVLDEDPGNTNNVLLLYARRSEPKGNFGGTMGWNREHLWPNSYGLDDRHPAYSDLHNLRAEDIDANAARAMFYMDVRYEGGASGEPDLILTEGVQRLSNTTNLMGRLSTLLLWHEIDPVDDAERMRNDKVFTLYQRNRNPFVDRPEWVREIFWPRVEIAAATNGGVTLTWSAAFTNAVLQSAGMLPPGWLDRGGGTQALGELRAFSEVVSGELSVYRLRLW